VGKLEKRLAAMRASPTGVAFSDLRAVCDHYFGAPRQAGGSHLVYAMPWPGDPRVNIQDRNGEAVPYQVRQVLTAIDKLEEER